VDEDGRTETPTLLSVAPPVENPPTAVQDDAFDEDQVSVDVCPLLMVSGDAESETVGAEDTMTNEEETDTIKPLLTVSPVEALLACREYPYTPPPAVDGAVTD